MALSDIPSHLRENDVLTVELINGLIDAIRRNRINRSDGFAITRTPSGTNIVRNPWATSTVSGINELFPFKLGIHRYGDGKVERLIYLPNMSIGAEGFWGTLDRKAPLFAYSDESHQQGWYKFAFDATFVFVHALIEEVDDTNTGAMQSVTVKYTVAGSALNPYLSEA